MKKKSLELVGASNSAPTEIQQAGPSTNAESESTSGTLVQTAQASQICQDTTNLPESTPGMPNALVSKMLMAFANPLVHRGLLEWRSVVAGDGRKGWVLFFPAMLWEKKADGELTPNAAGNALGAS